MLRGVRWISCLLCCLPSVGLALDWALLGPLPSPTPGAIAAPAQAALNGESDREMAGLAGAVRWTVPHPGPVDLRALTHAPPGGTFYARAQFGSDHSGPLAVRVRCDAAFRVWLDGRLIGGRNVAKRWTDAPVALPAMVKPGAHRLLIEVRPPHARTALLAAALTTPTGVPIEWRRSTAAAQAAVLPETPIALRRAKQPSAMVPAGRWQPPIPQYSPLKLPELPIDWQARPRWPDAGWTLFANAVVWQLDTRQAAQRVGFRVDSPLALATARRFATRFDRRLHGGRSIAPGMIEVGMFIVAERQWMLPADPLKLGAARLDPIVAPTWHLTIDVDAPRDWSLTRAARGMGGARQFDDQPGRRRWRYTATALPARSATLRVSRVDGLAAFARQVSAATRDHIRPYPDAPPCKPSETGLVAAIDCARTGRPLGFGYRDGRPPLEGPIDLADFNWIGSGTPPEAVDRAVYVDRQGGHGGFVRGRPQELRHTLTPQAPELPSIPLGGPCADGPTTPTGRLTAWVDVTLTGLAQVLPRSRTQTRHGMRLVRDYRRTPAGWKAQYQLSWANQARVAPARVAATCALWGLR